MVGVAGRSIACHTCKKRKIRCGGEKPECNNCAKSGRSCAGYQRQHIFILSKYTDSSHCNEKNENTRHDRISTSTHCRKSFAKHDHFTVATETTMAAKPEAPSLPASVPSRNVLRTQLLASFIDEQCPPSIIGSIKYPGPHRRWLFQLADLPFLSPALEEAILAVSIAKFSQSSKIKALQRESLSLYGKGLRKLQRAIDNPKTRYEEQTVTTVIVLGMYEFVESPERTADAYIRHYNGTLELMRVRGSQSHGSGLAHGVLQVMRVHAAFQSLRERQPSFLLQPEWLQASWTSTTKEPYDLLLDIFLTIPNLMSKMSSGMTENMSGMPLYENEGENVAQFCDEIYKQLQNWQFQYERTFNGPLYWPVFSTAFSTTDDVESGKLFPVSYNFPSFIVAETMVLFWTVSALLHSITLSTLRRLSPSPASTIQQPNDKASSQIFADKILTELNHHQELLKTSIRDICQSLCYFCQDHNRQIGPSTILPSIVVMRAIFAFNGSWFTREKLWINEKLEEMRIMGVLFVGSII